MANETTNHTEVERKFEGRPRSTFELTRVEGVTAVVDLEPKPLRAIYYDTPDLRLAARGTTLRERSGGDDGGWHLKVPMAHGEKLEVRVSPAETSIGVPTVLSDDVRALTRDVALVPVMKIRTERHEQEVLDDQRRVLAVLASDEVTATPLLPSGDPVTWSEREVELVEGDDALLDRLARHIIRSDLRPSAWPSKLAHALAATSLAPEPAATALDPSTAGGILVAHLRDQVDLLELHDVGVRCGQPDAVHQMRVATRRLRSALATFRPLLAGPRWEQVRTELKGLGEALGHARDAEVMQARLARNVGSLPVEQVLGPVHRRIDRTLRGQASEALGVVLAQLDDAGYLRLLDELESLLVDPPLTKRAEEAAKKVLPKHVRHAGRRVARADRDLAQGGASESDPRMHEVRKAAKRARYAAEAAEPTLGQRARGMARRAEAVQDLLGEHQDSVTARSLLRQLGVQAHLAGENGYTFGVLYGMEDCRAGGVGAEYKPAVRALLESVAKV